MTTRLNQVIALEKGTKTRAVQELADQARQLSIPTLLSGISKTYQPREEEGETRPAESTRVQVVARDILGQTAATFTRLLDITATKDWANCTAKADVVVDGQTIVPGAPVTYLLYLEKQLADLHAYIRKVPVLDPAEEWEHDPATNVQRSKPVQTVSNKKVPRNHVVHEGTAQHAPQVVTYQEDVPVGTWTTTKFSGAMPAAAVAQMTSRVQKLIDAVKVAREEANTAVVADVHVGEDVFAFILG